jgi:hypothetical protein
VLAVRVGVDAGVGSGVLERVGDEDALGVPASPEVSRVTR